MKVVTLPQEEGKHQLRNTKWIDQEKSVTKETDPSLSEQSHIPIRLQGQAFRYIFTSTTWIKLSMANRRMAPEICPHSGLWNL